MVQLIPFWLSLQSKLIQQPHRLLHRVPFILKKKIHLMENNTFISPSQWTKFSKFWNSRMEIISALSGPHITRTQVSVYWLQHTTLFICTLIIRLPLNYLSKVPLMVWVESLNQWELVVKLLGSLHLLSSQLLAHILLLQVLITLWAVVHIPTHKLVFSGSKMMDSFNGSFQLFQLLDQLQQ